MRNIAILTCLRACGVCTGASCLRAWNTKRKSFAPYEGGEVQLAAFMHCNGCEKDPESDQGMQEKLERLTQENVEIVHLGICTKDRSGAECATITQLAEMLEARGISLVRGTH